MRLSTYQALPLETLFELLIDGVKKLLVAHCTEGDTTKEFDSHKKYVGVLLTLIEEKKKEEVKISLTVSPALHNTKA